VRNTTKRPASVVFAILILAIMIASSVKRIIYPFELVGPALERGFLAQNRLPLVMLLVNSGALLSILFRTSWAGWVSGIVLTLWSVLLIFLGLIYSKFMGALFLFAGTLLWLAYSLALGTASRKYFHHALEPLSSENQSESQITSGSEMEQPQTVGVWKCPRCGQELEAQFDSCWHCAGTNASE
jgi:predicted RNA-binding Zn-ribbon protein involved in translation (DUF1610 family)